ncbi:MAG TPA: mechanosensitive ion channel domain-containing protein [Terriglobia bacterium]|nr:mechanosensitive ion channel domain-containing protein [Terriglobia bacterium]
MMRKPGVTLPAATVRRLTLSLLMLCLMMALTAVTGVNPVITAQAQESSGAALPAPASPTAGNTNAGNINAAQARQTLDVLQNDDKRNQLIQVLQTIANTPAANAPAGTAAGSSGNAAPTLSQATPQQSSQPSSQAAPAAPKPATPPPAAPAAPAAATAPAATPPATPPATPGAAVAAAAALPADSLGAQLLEQLAEWLDDATTAIGDAVRNVADLPRIWTWLVQSLSDPRARNMLFNAAWRLAVVIGCAVVAEYCLRFLLRRPLYLIERRAAYLHDLAALGAEGASSEDAFNPDAPDTPVEADAAETTPSDIDPGALEASGNTTVIVPRDASGLPRKTPRGWLWLRRVPWALLHFLLSLVPVVVFAVAGNSLLGTDLGDPKSVRLAGIAAVNAYVLVRAVSCVTQLFVMSRSPGLRLLPLRDGTAAYIEVWVFRIAGTGLFGAALAEMALLLGLSRAGHEALLKVVTLIVDVYVVIVILQCRHTVAQWLHARPGRVGPIAALLNRLASLWHIFAIFLALALWLVWAMEIRHGFTKLADMVLVLIGILVAARIVTLLLHAAFDRLFRIDDEMERRFPGLKQRANRYYPLLRSAITLLVTAIGIIALLQAWGLDAFAWFHGDEVGSRLVSAVVTVAVAAALAVGVWEGSNLAIDRHMMRLDHSGDYLHAARLRTLVPIMRTVLLIIVSIVVILTILSEIGVNIAPLLAGASIVGVAIGFGSQKLVQDFITGIFLLLENAMQVGDTITASGLTGTVEKLSIRTIRLRAGDGAVHIIPFSSVGTVTNVNRGVGNAAVRVTIADSEDVDAVGEILKQIAKDMRADDDYRRMMRSDLQFWGVDDVQPGAVTLAGQIVCSDAGRWGVQREFNRRMVKRFAELGVKLAAPSQYLILTHPLRQEALADAAQAETPAQGAAEHAPHKSEAATDSQAKESAASVRNSPPPSALGHTE